MLILWYFEHTTVVKISENETGLEIAALDSQDLSDNGIFYNNTRWDRVCKKNKMKLDEFGNEFWRCINAVRCVKHDTQLGAYTKCMEFSYWWYWSLLWLRAHSLVTSLHRLIKKSIALISGHLYQQIDHETSMMSKIPTFDIISACLLLLQLIPAFKGSGPQWDFVAMQQQSVQQC